MKLKKGEPIWKQKITIYSSTVSSEKYEIEKNEAKRSIDLIDDSLVASVFNEVRKSLKNA